MAADIGNAYLQASTSSKYYTKLGLEFGPDDEGRVAYIVQWHTDSRRLELTSTITYVTVCAIPSMLQ